MCCVYVGVLTGWLRLRTVRLVTLRGPSAISRYKSSPVFSREIYGLRFRGTSTFRKQTFLEPSTLPPHSSACCPLVLSLYRDPLLWLLLVGARTLGSDCSLYSSSAQPHLIRDAQGLQMLSFLVFRDSVCLLFLWKLPLLYLVTFYVCSYILRSKF